MWLFCAPRRCLTVYAFHPPKAAAAATRRMRPTDLRSSARIRSRHCTNSVHVANAAAFNGRCHLNTAHPDACVRTTLYTHARTTGVAHKPTK